ncbi:MAG: MopE-related protein [Flavobacteriia bacterium]
MKRFLLVLIVFIGFQGFTQAFEPFNFTGAANANGWATQSGTAGELLAITTLSTSGNSLSFTGLQASVGNRINLTSTGTEDINKVFVPTGTSAYMSFLLKVQNITGLTAGGAYFTGFGGTSGATVTVYFPRIFIKTGTTPGTFQVGVLNTSGGTGAVASYISTEYTPGTTLFIVVKASSPAVGGVISSSLWVNPIPGAAAPAAGVTNAGGTSTWPTNGVQSVFLRQAAGTGNLEVDEIRAGTTWAAVTPAAAASCISYNTITTTACSSYTLNAQTYSTSGTYIQTLANANAAGCDSIINLNLTINQPSTSTINVTNCGPYTINGQTYASTGLYMQSLTNAVGCDSMLHVNLTVVSNITYYQDLDGDGYGNFAVSQVGCSPITGYVTNSTDCNDNNNAIYPGATEIEANGIDEDCNGVDAPLSPVNMGLYEFTDVANCPVVANNVTTQPVNATFGPFTNMGSNCTSTANVFNNTAWNTSGAVDVNQYNQFSISGNECYNLNLAKIAFNHRVSSTGGTPVIYLRSSLDNYVANIDTIASAWNGNVMLDDTISLPVEFANVHAVTFRFYVTSMATNTSTFRMDNVSLWGNSFSVAPTNFYADLDQDGFGDLANDTLVCTMPAGFVTNSQDCNDADAGINPNTVWYMDMDGDLLGDLMATFTGCTPPTGYVLTSGDCDDTNASVTTPITYYSDVDQDGFGDDATAADFCLTPPGMVAVGGDCNDNNNAIYPGATEICDGFDNNCNGTNDEGLIFNTYYLDSDNDQFGAGLGLVSCQVNPLPGYVLVNGDCDDMNPNVYPGATEILANDLDENCDGVDGYLGLTDVTFTNVSLVPNPSNGTFTIQLDTEISDVNILITDMSGKVLFHSVMSGSILELTQTQLKAGTYLVNVQLNQQREILRLVIQ